MAGLFAASRSEDGRGPKTELEQLVPAHFGYDAPSAVAYAMHVGELSRRRVIELAPVVLGSDDPVALEIGDRLADEIVALARATFVRLGFSDETVEVLVGGGLMRSADQRLLARIEHGLREVGAGIVLLQTSQPPIVGAALLGLDAVGADAVAQQRLRAELGAAVERIETERSEVA
jgi:N-acetylglucosamine kinase-like BadF-type ATPase